MSGPGAATSARGVALEAVLRVCEEGAYSSRVVPALLGRSGLDRRDRAFAAEIAYGTLRRLLALDWAIGQRASRPLQRMGPRARAVLRIGAYQLLVAGIPAHAAVAESVGLAGDRERGFVNAVLRRLAAEPPAWPQGQDDASISVRTGMSAWAIRELRRVLRQPDEVEVAAAGFAERGPLSLHVNRCRTSPGELRDRLEAGGVASAPGRVNETCLLVDRGDPTGFPGWAEGLFAVQDQASAFVAEAVGASEGDRVLDACAGPGGKAAGLACAVGPAGLVVAADLHPGRARLVREGSARLGLRPSVMAMDACRPAVVAGFDRVLVDAPCSGLGSARRRPELLWRARKEELSSLARLQVAIVASVTDLLRPGGRLVYAVCTFPRAETDAAADAIVRHRPDLHPIAIEGPDGSGERVRLWPHLHGCDAMFVAAFERGR
jgi:16S rRNA (cytosine967-C5)-methyltransferase